MRIRRFIARLSMAVAAFGGLGLVAVTAQAAPAAAQCVAVPADGHWTNIDANTSGETAVDIHHGCGDVVLCDPSGHCTTPGGGITIRVWGKCHPTDCDWGTISGETKNISSGSWTYGVYNFGWATKYVWAKTYQYYGRTYLRLYVDVQFHDGRPNYTSDNWFLK